MNLLCASTSGHRSRPSSRHFWPAQSGRRQSACRAAPGAPSEALVTLEGVSKSHDGMHTLFEGLTFTVHRGERLAVIGANGSGKSSMLKLISGADWPDEGEVTIRKGALVGFLAQDAELADGLTAFDAVVQSDSPLAVTVRKYNELLSQGASVKKHELNKAQDAMTALGGWELEAKATMALEEVGIKSKSMRVEDMSGGQRRKVTVAAALLGAPDVLILDEPTNHMDVQFIKWMTDTILEDDMTLLLVTHDRAFMESTCTKILELDSGRGYVHSVGGAGSYAAFRKLREDRRAAQAAVAQDARVMLRKETEWMRRQPKARGTKSKARVEAFEDLTAQAKSGPRKDLQVSFGDVQMARQGNKVLIAKGISKEWSGHKFIRRFTYEFSPGERLGVVGPNGAGKSSLLDMLAGVTPTDEGEIILGDTSVVGYFAQHQPPVNPKLRVIDYITSIVDNAQLTDVIGLDIQPDRMLNLLGFPYERQRQLVSTLSGGERRRVHLASVLVRKPNVLILDEPTNDLDLTTIEVLEGLLEAYSGCVLIVSHDKAFMENVVDSMLSVDGSGPVQRFTGRYSDYLAMMERRLAAQAAEEEEARRQARAESSAAAAALRKDAPEEPALQQEAPKLRRLGFREKTEYVDLEQEIEKLSEEKDALEGRIAETAQNGDFEKSAQLSEELGVLAGQLDKKSERWLELAERAEAAGTV